MTTRSTTPAGMSEAERLARALVALEQAESTVAGLCDVLVRLRRELEPHSAVEAAAVADLVDQAPTAETAAQWDRLQWVTFIQECGFSVPDALAKARRLAERSVDQAVTVADLADVELAGFMLAACLPRGAQ